MRCKVSGGIPGLHSEDGSDEKIMYPDIAKCTFATKSPLIEDH